MRSVVIGGTGFIGSLLVERLVQDGGEVVCVARTHPEETIAGVEYVVLDLATDTRKLAMVIVEGDEIFLLTGQVHDGFSKALELEMFGGVLDVIQKSKPAKVFFTSSVLVYGHCDQPATEDQLLHPQDVYSAFKAECEQKVREMLPDTRVGILRLANVYGSKKNKGFVGLVMKKLLDGTVLKVNGDGLQKRDYIFLTDVVEAILAVRKRFTESDIVNIATGNSESLLQVIKLTEQASGKRLKYEVTGVPVEEIKASRIANEKLRERYGYTPFIFLAAGLQRAWKQYQ